MVVEREDGSLLIDGMMPAEDAFERLAFADVRPTLGRHLLPLGPAWIRPGGPIDPES